MIKKTEDCHLTFEPEGHIYRLDGREIPSVTTILKGVGLKDAYPSENMEWYGDRGTKVHLACHYLDRGTLDESTVAEEITGFVEAYKKAKQDLDIKVLASEGMVYDWLYWFAGTIDKVAEISGLGKAVIDLKTGSPQKADAYQTAAYAYAGAKNNHVLTRRFGLYLKQDGSYKLVEFTDPTDINVFHAACVVFHAQKRRN